jgi:hypothetical protein
MADQRAPYPVGHAQVRTIPRQVRPSDGLAAKVYQYKPGLFAHWQLIAFT